jgi:hypothetical protein
MVAVPTSTTITAAMDRTQRTVALASATGVAVGGFLVIGSEIVLIQESQSALVWLVERGQSGTKAKPHASGATVYVGSASTFATKGHMPALPVVPNDVTNVLPDFALPLGSRVVDPDTGYEYLVVDCQSALIPGHWVSIDQNGLATILTGDQDGLTTGRVGIITQTIGASDTLALALVVGRYSGALCTSAFTSTLTPNLATPTSLGPGMVAPAPSDTGTSASSGVSVLYNLIWGAVVLDFLTSAVSSGGTLDVLLVNPYLAGTPVNIHVGSTS